jgi:hypothetical protein
LYIGTSAHAALASALEAGGAYDTIFGANAATTMFANSGCRAPLGGQKSADIDAALPPLGLTFPKVGGGGSFTIQLPATKSYLMALGSSPYFCVVAHDAGAETGSGTIGGPAMRANLTIFDEANAQLGFAPQTFCD